MQSVSTIYSVFVNTSFTNRHKSSHDMYISYNSYFS